MNAALVDSPGLFEENVSPLTGPLAGCEAAVDGLRDFGRMAWQRGWSLGTSSNYSIVDSRTPLELIVTASGMDKGRLRRCDFVRVGDDGLPTTDDQPKASAETGLHVVAARQPGVGAILHTHSIWSTLLSDHFFAQGGFEIEGYEMLKGLSGITTHQTTIWVEIFDNTQDIPSLSEKVSQRFADGDRPLRHGYLIRRHGLYTWGRDLNEARRHIEIFEFLFECVTHRLSILGQMPAVGRE